MSKPSVSKDLAELAIKLKERHSTDRELLLAKSVSFRLPIDLHAWLAVMAKRAGESRTDLLVNMVRSSVNDLIASLDESTAQMLETQQLEQLDEIIRSFRAGSLGDLFQEEK